MNSYFSGQNKFLWGFSVKPDGEKESVVSKHKSEAIKKLIDHCFETNVEIHVMPNVYMPFIMIKTPERTFYYLQSENGAHCFRKHIMVDGGYELCQVI